MGAMAALSVAGVTHSYSVDNVPERLTRASLPMLMTMPFLDGGGLRKRDEFEMITPTGSLALVIYYVTHMLLYAPTGQYRNAAAGLVGLTDLMDTYANVIRANSTLGGLLYVPLQYFSLPGDILWGGVPYLGVRFVHRFVMET